MDARRFIYTLDRLGYVCGNIGTDDEWVDEPEDDLCVHGVLFSEPCEDCEESDDDET